MNKYSFTSDNARSQETTACKRIFLQTLYRYIYLFYILIRPHVIIQVYRKLPHQTIIRSENSSTNDPLDKKYINKTDSLFII